MCGWPYGQVRPSRLRCAGSPRSSGDPAEAEAPFILADHGVVHILEEVDQSVMLKGAETTDVIDLAYVVGLLHGEPLRGAEVLGERGVQQKGSSQKG